MKPDRWHDVKRLFNSAMQSAPQKRTAYLEQVCRGDESLRLEVECLMTNDPGAQVFLETPALNVAARALGVSRLTVIRNWKSAKMWLRHQIKHWGQK
jgi:hypothetical protein